MLWRLAQIAYGVAAVGGLLALQALILYALWRVVLLVVSAIPMIGKRHRHHRWDELNEERSRCSEAGSGLPPSERDAVLDASQTATEATAQRRERVLTGSE